MKKTVFSLLVVILFAVFVQEKIVEQDVLKAIVSYNNNPTFTKETITEKDFNGAAITILSYCKQDFHHLRLD